MNYKQIYENIIAFRKKNVPVDCYTEIHHIIPKSLGGTDAKTNLVRLTAKEHFICHRLLVKIQRIGTNQYYCMLNAFLMMLWCKDTDQNRYTSSRKYAALREQYSAYQSEKQTGTGNSQFGSRWISNPITGETKKIRGTDTLSKGWVIGRNRKFLICANCQQQFINKFKKSTCSKSCEKELKSKLKGVYWNKKLVGETKG